MAIKKTPRAVIDVLDSQGNITGHEIENIYTWEAESPDDPMVKLFASGPRRDEATEAEADAVRGKSSAGLTEANQALNLQVASLQAQVADLTKRLTAAVNALNAVAQADTSWDTSPRAQVIDVLKAEGL